MRNFLFSLAKLMIFLFSSSPILLCFAICAEDIGVFFHYWLIYFAGTFIMFFVSLVAAQLV